MSEYPPVTSDFELMKIFLKFSDETNESCNLIRPNCDKIYPRHRLKFKSEQETYLH